MAGITVAMWLKFCHREVARAWSSHRSSQFRHGTIRGLDACLRAARTRATPVLAQQLVRLCTWEAAFAEEKEKKGSILYLSVEEHLW